MHPLELHGYANVENEKQNLKNDIKKTKDEQRFRLIERMIEINKTQSLMKEEKRRKHINKIVEKIAIGDVNSKNFWELLKRIGKKDSIETKYIVNDEGIIMSNCSEAKEYIRN